MFLPDTILTEIILRSHPETLHWIINKKFSEKQLGFLYNSLDKLIEIINSKFIVYQLCDQHSLDKCNTFNEFLYSWNVWNIDIDVSLVYFSLEWHKYLTTDQALYVCGRNARTDKRWLIVANQILDTEMLWCSEKDIIKLCRGLAWSDYVNLYKHRLCNYLTEHNITHDILYPIDEECNQEAIIMGYKDGNITVGHILNGCDYHTVKQYLPKIPRLTQLQGAIINDDTRVMYSVKPTAEELKNMMLILTGSTEYQKAKYLCDLGIKIRNWSNLFQLGVVPGTTEDQIDFYIDYLENDAEHICNLFNVYCQAERSGPSTEGGQAERSGPSTEGGQAERSGPSTEGGQAERSGPSTEGGQVERSGPSTFSRRGENLDIQKLSDFMVALTYKDGLHPYMPKCLRYFTEKVYHLLDEKTKLEVREGLVYHTKGDELMTKWLESL